jgi:hypothetical protein
MKSLLLGALCSVTLMMAGGVSAQSASSWTSYPGSAHRYRRRGKTRHGNSGRPRSFATRCSWTGILMSVE